MRPAVRRPWRRRGRGGGTIRVSRESRGGEGVGRPRDIFRRAATSAGGLVTHLERLGRGNLVDHVAVDVQEEGAVLLLVDDVILDDLVVHGLARGDDARGGGARAGHHARRAEGLARDRLLAGEGGGAGDDPGSGHGGGGHHDRASPSGEGVRREVRGVVTARVCVVICTRGARRGRNESRIENIEPQKASTVGGGISAWRSRVCDSRIVPDGNLGTRVWRPHRATARDRERPPPRRRRGGASERAHRRARLPEAGSDRVTRRDVRRGPRVRLPLSRASRPRAFCSAPAPPRFRPSPPCRHRPPVARDLTIASPARLHRQARALPPPHLR
jgi:hypothetical protein